eukprot:6132143-Prymnesium_polylepis.1
MGVCAHAFSADAEFPAPRIANLKIARVRSAHLAEVVCSFSLQSLQLAGATHVGSEPVRDVLCALESCGVRVSHVMHDVSTCGANAECRIMSDRVQCKKRRLREPEV